MGERDAFGREIGEDTLSGLRGDGDASIGVSEPARPAPAEPTEVAQAPIKKQARPRQSTAFPDRGGRPQKGAPRRKTGSGSAASKVAGMIATLVVLGVVGSVAVGVIAAVGDAVDSVDNVVRPSFTVPDTSEAGLPKDAQEALDEARRQIEAAGASRVATTAAPTIPSAPPQAEPVLGLQRGSFLTKSALKAGLAKVREQGANVRTLRVAPDRIDASVVSNVGRQKQVQVTREGVRVITTSSSASVQRDSLIELASINTSAPFRLTVSGAGRLKQPTTKIDYLVLYDFAGSPRWSVFFKGGSAFAGDSRGKVLRLIS